jgi:hypothetical protein
MAVEGLKRICNHAADEFYLFYNLIRQDRCHILEITISFSWRGAALDMLVLYLALFET